MPSPFSSLLRSVHGDGYRSSLTALSVGVGLLLPWLGWFLLGRIPIHAVSGEARLVVSTEALPVEAPLGGGRIAVLRMELGQMVRAGEVLLELEADEQRLLLQESNARRTGLAARLAALTREIQEEKDAQTLHALRRELADLEGRLATEAALCSRLEYEQERRKLRAPITGRVGEVASLSVGLQLRGGERLGSVVPPGDLKVVASFPPSEAIGRIREGQTARVRLDGFPWTQYGMIDAHVSRVASEARDGRIRVECAVAPDPSSLIPFQHGLTGRVEIEVERASPVSLVLRAAGMRLTGGGAR